MRFAFCICAFATILSADGARAATLILSESALLKLMKAELFKRDGRYYLAGPEDCNDPYLETPVVTVRDGRVQVRAHFSGRVGTKQFGVCVGIADPSWIVLSGKPYASGKSIGLDDLVLENVEKPLVKTVLEQLLRSLPADGFKFDVEKGATAALVAEKTAPYTVALPSLAITGVAAQAGELVISLDFKLAVQ